MTKVPRIILSFFIALIIFVCVVHFMAIPEDQILPPPFLYKNCVGTTIGTVTGVEEKGYGDHLMEGDSTFYYVDYTYQAIHHVEGAHGKTQVIVDPKVYNGRVRIVNDLQSKLPNGTKLWVLFNPQNPAISGLKDAAITVNSQWSTNTGYWNPYLYWYLGLIGVTWLIQEVIRLATRTNDL